MAITEQASRRGCAVRDVSLILLELGGAFTAALAVAGGAIVDGVGGSAGPIGFRAPGALDGEVAYLAGHVTKALLFRGGVDTVRGGDSADPEVFAQPTTADERMALEALVEGAAKAVAGLTVAVPLPTEIVVSGRLARSTRLYTAVADRLRQVAPVHRLQGFARVAKEAAQGAALIADGLVGGAHTAVVESLAIRDAAGTVLDHLYVITREQARQRLGLGDAGASS